MFQEEGRFGVGVVARDSEGQVRGVVQGIYQGVPPVQEAEVRGLLDALRWAEHMRWPRVVFETDCLSVVQGLRSEVVSHTEFGELITRCREPLGLQPQAEVVFVRRDCNGAAHAIARRSIAW
ncbi:hypothetical protein LINPERPRIM_LOCUS2806 [Linum perenne]